MPIQVFEQTNFGFQVVKVSGVVDEVQLRRMLGLYAQNMNWVLSDTIHILTGEFDSFQIEDDALEALRRDYHTLYQSADFYVVRRSGWLCRGARGFGELQKWLRGRHALDGLSSEIALAVEIEKLAPLFDREELEAVERWRDFALLAAIDGDDTKRTRADDVSESDFVAFTTALADTGGYINADEVRLAMSRVAGELVERFWAEDLHRCLNIRCARAGAA